ncbi:hypothetical protein ABVK25_004686 [Lepraria finkii]|uniref:NAD(P)-binding protein n=1 Tax=Lepraria finkii TaxID=1340010 RepID=A0ABR4BAI4_9LECA
MAADTGPPKGEIKFMTPFKIADDPPPSQPIPDVVHPEKSPADRATARFSLAGKKAIVTGGAQGLGLVCARALLEHGVSLLAIFDVDKGCGERALEHFESLKKGSDWKILFKQVDVTNEDSVNSAVHEVTETFDGIEILLCFAGITESKLAVEYPTDSWRRIFDVNVHGSFLVARAFAREVITRDGSGTIVFTASMSGYIVNQPQPHSAYAVSKAGVHHLARSMAAEWVGHNIRVNSISPGIMNTRLSGGPSQAGLRRLWLEKSPMGIGDPEDLTGAVVLLCSEAGKFITGTDVKIDGGYTIF